MRHNRRTGKLDRSTAERKALLRSLAIALFNHQRITTTLAKAKEASRFSDKLITTAKKANLAAHRALFAVLLDKALVKELVAEIAPRFKNRHGGYTRIIRLSGRRRGDNAELAMLELTEQKVVEAPAKKHKKEPKPKAAEKGQEAPKEGAAPEQQKHAPKEDKHAHVEKPKKNFFHGLQKFLRPPKTTG